MAHRRAPRPVAFSLEALTARLAPAGPLARVQAAWPEAVGPAVAAAATPVSEHGGTVTVRCSSSAWAQELDLMGPELVERLNTAAGDTVVTCLRFRVS